MRQIMEYAVYREAFLVVLLLPALSVAQEEDPHADLDQTTDSQICLSCHDGMIGDLEMNHPYDVDYLTAKTNRPGAALRPISDLPPAILLIDGRMVCITCHDMESTGPFKLSISLESSAICFACHDE